MLKRSHDGTYRYMLVFLMFSLFTNYGPTGTSISVLEASEPEFSDQDTIENIQISVFHSVALEPAKVTMGGEVTVKAVFSISKGGLWDTLPVEYFYKILKGDTIFFESPSKKISVGNGAKSVLEIKAEVPGGYGDYKFILELKHPDGIDHADIDFSIVSLQEANAYARGEGLLKGASTARDLLDERLVGRWRFVTPNPNTPTPELTIKKEKNKLVAAISKKGARTHWVKLRKNDKNLVLRSKTEASTGGCWYVVEDVITFNAGMDNMSVRSKVLDGNQCASVGKVSESRLRRIQ